MNNYEQVARLMSPAEQGEEDQACAFINNIMDGSYDESGEILLKGGTFEFADWKNPRQYRRLKMSLDQALLLSFSIVLCVALATIASIQQRAFKRKGKESPWSDSRLFHQTYQKSEHGLMRRRPSLGDNQPLQKTSDDGSIRSARSRVTFARPPTPYDPDAAYTPPENGCLV